MKQNVAIIYKNNNNCLKSLNNLPKSNNYLQQKMLKLLIIILTLTTIKCDKQDGTWQSTNYTSTNFLFNFLRSNSGAAYIQTQSKVLYVSLQSTNLQIKMTIEMQSPSFITDELYRGYDKKIKFRFIKKNLLTYSNEQQQANKILFNITLAHRQQLKLISKEGEFVIQLVDIEVSHPNLLIQLNLFVFIIGFLSLCASGKFNKNYIEEIPFTDLLSYFSIQALLLWNLKYLIEIYSTASYFTYSYLRFFSNCLTVIGIIILFIQLISIIITSMQMKIQEIKSPRLQLSKDGVICLLVLIRIAFWVCQLLLLFDLTNIRLIHIILMSFLYQLITILLNVKSRIDVCQIVSHFILYLFPIAIFPYFGQYINYPQNQAACWWLYIIIFISQIAIYQLKSNVGVWINIKRCRYSLKKRRQKKSYLEIENSLCPVCYQEIEIDKSLENAAADSKVVVGVEDTFIKNSCNHYFHKECIKDPYVLKFCYFDNEKWSLDLLQLRKKNDLASDLQ